MIHFSNNNNCNNNKRFVMFVLFLLLSLLYSSSSNKNLGMVNAQQSNNSTNSTITSNGNDIANNNNNNNGGNNALLLLLVSTFVPTISLFPTNTAYPSYENICYICGSASNMLIDPNQIVSLEDGQYSCSDLQIVGLNRMFNDVQCSTVQQTGCDCTIPLLVPTFAPTTSISPTITGVPSYKDICYICGDETKVVSNPNQLVLWYGGLFFCRELQEEGRNLDSEMCTILRQAGCDCTSITSLITTTPSPTSSRLLLSLTSSLHPSSQQPTDGIPESDPLTTTNESQPPVPLPITVSNINTMNTSSAVQQQIMVTGIVIIISMLFLLIQSHIF